MLTLNEDHELKNFYAKPEDFEAHGISVYRLVICDFVGAPQVEDIDQAVNHIKKVVNAGKMIYIHCKAGRSRSSLILAAYLMREQTMTAEQAYAFLKSKRRHVDFHAMHWEVLGKYKSFYEADTYDGLLGTGFSE